MHNLLFNVSAVLLQKNLEKEADSRDREEFGVLELNTEELKPSDSILPLPIRRLLHKRAAQSVVAPNLKNKTV